MGLLIVLAVPSRSARMLLRQAQPFLAELTGLEWSYDEAQVALVGNTLILRKVAVRVSEVEEPLATADKLILRFRWRGLIQRSRQTGQPDLVQSIRGASLEGVVVNVRRTPDGFDLAELFSQRTGTGTTPPLTGTLTIRDARVVYTDYPLRPGSSTGRDWNAPQTVALGVRADARLQRGVLTNAAVTITHPDDPQRVLLVATGGADFAERYSLTLTPHLQAADLQPGEWLAPLLTVYAPQIAQQSGALRAGTVSGRLLAVGALDGSLPRFAGDLHLRGIEVAHPLLGADPLLADGDLSLDPLRWRLTRGVVQMGAVRFDATGALDPTDPAWPVQARFLAAGVPLTAIPIPLPFRETVGYQGPVLIQGQVTGTLSDPMISASLSAPSVLLAGQAFELLPAPVQYRQGLLRVQATARQGAQQITLAGSADLQAGESGFQLELRQVPARLLRRALPAFEPVPLEGPVSAAITMVSNREQGNRTDIQLVSREGMLGPVPYGAILGRLRYEREQLHIQRLVATLPQRAHGAIAASGRWDPAGAMDISVQAGGVELAQLLPGGPLRGELFGTLHLSGSLAAPRGGFTVQVLDGQAGPLPVHRLMQHGELTPSTLVLSDGVLETEGLRGTLAGQIDLRAAEPVALSASLTQTGTLPAGAPQPRNVRLDLALTGALNNLQLEASLSGGYDFGATRFRIAPEEPLIAAVSGLGLLLPAQASSWETLVAMLGAGTRLAEPVTLTHQGTLQMQSLAAATETFDPWFAKALREAAPSLAPVLLAAQGTAGLGPAITGSGAITGTWQWSAGEWTGASVLEGSAWKVSEHEVRQVRWEVSRAAGEPVQIRLEGETAEGGQAVLAGTSRLTQPLGDSPIDVTLSLDRFPVNHLVAWGASALVPHLEGTLSGSGRFAGTLTVPETASPLQLELRHGRLADITGLSGGLDLGLVAGQLQLHRLDLTAPEGLSARGQGTIFLSADEFSSSTAAFDLAGIPLEKLRPLMGPGAPDIAGRLDFSAAYAFLEGVPGLRGVLHIERPSLGLLRIERLRALLNYNPFTRRLLVEEDRPLYLESGEHRLLVHGQVHFVKDGDPLLALTVETPAGRPPIPLTTILAPTPLYSAVGGLEALYLRVSGTSANIQLDGDALVELRDVRLLNQPVFTQVGGVLHFSGQQLLLESRQFWLENSTNGRRGRIALEGALNLAALMDARGTATLGTLALRPEQPDTVLPLTGFGLSAGLRVADPESGSLTRPLRFQLSGREVQIAGDLDLAPGTLDLARIPDFTAQQAAVLADAPAASTVRSDGPPLAFDLNVRIPAGFEVVGPSGLKVQLAAGALRVSGNPLAPSVTGTIRAPTGSLTVLGKEFRLVEPATLLFNSIYGLNPRIQATAETRVETLDAATLTGRRSVTITVTVNAQLQDLGEESSSGLTFTSSDPTYGSDSQILALLAGFGGDRPAVTGQDTPLTERFLRGLGNAAVSLPGQFVGQLFEEQGFRRFLIGTDVEGDIFVDAEYRIVGPLSLDYRQSFGTSRDWDLGLRYEFRNNSYLRIGTTEDWGLVGSLEYRLPLGGNRMQESREDVAAAEAELAAREAERDAAAKTLPSDYDPLDEDRVIEGQPGSPEVQAGVLEDEEAGE